MTEEHVCETECKCKACKYICKFLFLTGAIFLGTLLALLLANALQRPKFPPCPCNCMKNKMHGIEKQLPQHHMDKQKNDVMHENFNPERFNKPQRPERRVK